MTIERGEKLAILGPNGCGKSTLLKLIMGMIKPDRGEVLLGEHNVLPNYFEQNQVCFCYCRGPSNSKRALFPVFTFFCANVHYILQAEALDLDKTVVETVAEAAEDWRLDDIKGLLGRYNFKADMLDRKVSFLSGGEKVYMSIFHFSLVVLLHILKLNLKFLRQARLAFCKFMVTPSTLLVLDEPTNHLDIPTKEMLEVAFLNNLLFPLHSKFCFLICYVYFIRRQSMSTGGLLLLFLTTDISFGKLLIGY